MSTELLQEILHRFISIRMLAEGQQLLRDFATLMANRIAALEAADVRFAAALAADHPGFSARDLVHLALMRRLGATSIVSADSGFDGVEGVTRLAPEKGPGVVERVAATPAGVPFP